MRLDKDAIKESLTEEEAQKVLDDLGSDRPSKDIHGNPIFQTVCHNNHHGSHKLYYYKDSHLFQCYTNCGGMDIYEVVIKAKEAQGINLTFPEALKYVAETTGRRIVKSGEISSSNVLVDEMEWLERVTRKRAKLEIELPSFNEHVLEVFIPYQDNWLSEGIDRRIAEEFEVAFYLKEKQIIIPHRDINGRLVGIRSRNTDERAEMGMKYIPTTVGNEQYNHVVSHNLYGLYQNKEAIKRIKKVMFVEGEKSVMKCYGFYDDYNFTVAVSGSNISPVQRDMVLDLGVEEVFIAFDRHADGATENQIDNYKDRLLRLANMFTPYVRTYIVYDDFGLTSGDSAPVDYGQEVLEELMRKKYEISTYGME